MLYFAYAQDLNPKSIEDWFEHHRLRQPVRRLYRPAALANHRIGFWNWNEYWQSSVAGIHPAPGKRVYGALIDLPLSLITELGRMNGFTRDGDVPARGPLIHVDVTPFDERSPVRAVTYRRLDGAREPLPPTPAYLSRLLEAVHRRGLSDGWMMHLQTFNAIPLRGVAPIELPPLRRRRALPTLRRPRPTFAVA